MRKVYFIGIGGIGVSALAQYYLSRGFEVSGSDLVDSPIIQMLKKSGAKIFVGDHKASNLSEKADLVVFSAAVEKNNPELLCAKRKKIKSLSYSQALGELTKDFFTICVSGIHGKSTTTSMIALILAKAGLDPTVIVGAKLKEFGDKNFKLGKSHYLVIEADEYQASFLNYWPKIIVLLNLEEEHLDFYKDLKHIMETFQKYIGNLSTKGTLVVNEDDKNILKMLNSPSTPGLRRASKFQILNVEMFSLKQIQAKKLKKILKVPGEHNISNALAALSVARALNIPDKISFAALANFKGIWRRFEYRGKINEADIFDDYGHHPTEIESTLKGARQWMKKSKKKGRLWLVFQPHQYQRTFKLLNNFTSAFDETDNLILLPTYTVAGREDVAKKKKVSSKKLADLVEQRWRKSKLQKKAVFLSDFRKAKKYLKDNLSKNDLCIIMGAGNIWQLTQALLNSTYVKEKK